MYIYLLINVIKKIGTYIWRLWLLVENKGATRTLPILITCVSCNYQTALTKLTSILSVVTKQCVVNIIVDPAQMSLDTGVSSITPVTKQLIYHWQWLHQILINISIKYDILKLNKDRQFESKCWNVNELLLYYLRHFCF